MSTIYNLAHGAEEITTLLDHAMKQWHEPLHEAKVRVGILWAGSDTEAPALKHGGYPVLAMIKPIGLDWRVLCQVDAVLKVDEEKWNNLEDASKVALLDHELSHLELVLDPDTGKPKIDDAGRPKLRTVKGDWNGGDGFRAVVERHGQAAVELINARKVHSYAQAAAAEFVGSES